MKRLARQSFQVVLSFALSLVFVWLSLRGTDLREVGQALAHADLRWVALYGVVLSAIHVTRVVRWGLLLKPLADVNFRALNPLGAVGFMALMVMPLRLGEFARPLLVADTFKVRRSAALASVVVERIVDGLAMGAVLVTLLWTLGGIAPTEHLARIRVGSVFVTLAFGGGLVALVLAFLHRERAATLLRATIGRVSPRIADRLAQMLEAFTEALRVQSLRHTAEFFGLTALYWCINAAGLAVMAEAFGFSLSPLQAFTVLGLQVIGAMIPAGPGSVGTLQFFTVLGLQLFLPHDQRSAASAAAYSHVVWIMQFAQQVLFGLVAIGSGSVQVGGLFKRLRSGAPETDPSPNA